MAERTVRRGETLDLGGGVTVTLTSVGRVEAWFRAVLPPGAEFLRDTESPPRSGASQLSHSAGFALTAGRSVAVGGTRVRLTAILPGSRPRVGAGVRLRLDPVAPPPGTPPAVRSIDDVSADELARLLARPEPPHPRA